MRTTTVTPQGAGACLEADVLACLMPGFDGTVAPSWLLDLARRGLGSVCLFGSNIHNDDQIRALTKSLHDAGHHLLLAIDEEGGDVTRLDARAGSTNPGNAALGFIDDVGLTEEVATSLGRRLASLGIDWTLGPVADVNSNPDNPVIGTRAFGSDPEAVSRHCLAFARGLARGGVLACIKHFPGHGDTAVDSHHALPVLEIDLEHLERRELRPFAAAIRAGIDAVMVGHLLVPSLDDAVTSLSPAVIRGLLKERLGFGGVVVTDAVDMVGAAEGRGVVAAAVEALAAGADLVCLGSSTHPETVEAIIAAATLAVSEGRLRADDLGAAARKIRQLSCTVGLRRCGDPGSVDLENWALAAERSIELRGDRSMLGRTGWHVVDLESEPTMAAGDVPWGLVDVVTTADPTSTGTSVSSGNAAEPLGLRFPTVIAVRDLQRQPWQRLFVERAASAGVLAAVVDLGWPGPVASELSGRFPGVAWVSTRGSSLVVRRAIARILVVAGDVDSRGEAWKS